MRKSAKIFGIVLCCCCIPTIFADPGSGTLVVAGEQPRSFARSVLDLPSTPPSSPSPTVDTLAAAAADSSQEQQTTLAKIMDKWVVRGILGASAWTVVVLQLFAAMPDDYPDK